MNNRVRLPSIILPSRLLSSVVALNTVSNFFALGWSNLLSMLAIPLYIKILGTSEWGIVAACASLQILFNFIDSGVSQIVPRWVAREARDQAILRRYMVLFRKMYFWLGFTIFMLLQLIAGYLSRSWFQVPPDQAGTLEVAIRIVAFQFIFQFYNNLHIGLWQGLQKQVLANMRTCGFATLKHLTTLTILYTIAPQAWLYTSSFAIVALVEVVVNRFTVKSMLGRSGDVSGHVATIPFLKEVSVLWGGILVGLTISQLDRIILSRTVSLADYGVYTVVFSLAMVFLQLQGPFTWSLLPLLVQDFRTKGRPSYSNLKRLLCGTVVSATFPALLVCLFAAPILQFWLHNPKFVELGVKPLQLLLLAVAINTLYGCIYQVIIAAGESHLVIKINLIALAIASLVVLIIGNSAGLLLGGFIWVSASLTQLLIGILWFYIQRKKSRIVLLEGE